MIYILAKSLHLLFMAFWLATIIKGLCESLFITGTVRSDQRLRARHGRLEEILGIVSGVGAIASGTLLAFHLGFGYVPWPIHLGLLIAIVMGAIGGLGVGRAAHAIEKAIDNGAMPSTLKRQAKTLRNWYAVMLILWLSTFLLMVLRHLL